MASEAEIAEVRLNAGEPDDVDPYTDAYLSGLIDALGVASASLAVWRTKAAKYAGMVNISEAGASQSFSDLFAHAQTMIKQYEALVLIEFPNEPARVSSIVRTT